MANKKEFNKLVATWTAIFTKNIDDANYPKLNDEKASYDCRGDLYDDKSYTTNIPGIDITIYVSNVGLMDQHEYFTASSKVSKAARYKALKALHPDVDKNMFNRAYHTRFGYEIISAGILELCKGVCLRPRITKYNDLSVDYAIEWIKTIDSKILSKIWTTGPRLEALVEIVLGEGWKTRYYPIF